LADLSWSKRCEMATLSERIRGRVRLSRGRELCHPGELHIALTSAFMADTGFVQRGPVLSAEQSVPRPLQVAHLIVGLARAGAETSLLRLIQDTRGTLEHHVISMTNERALAADFEAAGARVTVLGSSRVVPNPLLPWDARRAILSRNPDVLHVWMLHAAALWSICRVDARIRRIPCVWGIRSTLNFDRISMSMQLARACACAASVYPHAIMFNSEYSRAEHARAGFCMERASVTHNGIDVPSEENLVQWRQDIRAKLGAREDTIVFVHVARAHPDKGVGDFVQAAQVVNGQLGKRAVFVRVGKPGWETGQRSMYVALERSPLIFHAGEQSNARPWLAAADVCVMSSLRESCPNVVLEAMSVGTPVVATDVGDAARLIGPCGWVVQPSSPRALADAMIAAASHLAKPANCDRFFADCRTAVASHHSREEVAQRQIAVYRDVIRHYAADESPTGRR